MNLLFKCYDKKDKEVKDVTKLDFADWWVGTDDGQGERNSFRNQNPDRHILMPHIGKKDINDVDICIGHIVEDITTGNIYAVEMQDFACVLTNGEKVIFMRDELKLNVIGCIYEPPIATMRRFKEQLLKNFHADNVQPVTPDINYRRLKGLKSRDMWGNVTEIVSVDTDVIGICTYRKHSHPSCLCRSVWRDDYYPEPTLMGGFDRVVTELKICGFDLEKLILDGYFDDNKGDVENESNI